MIEQDPTEKFITKVTPLLMEEYSMSEELAGEFARALVDVIDTLAKELKEA